MQIVFPMHPGRLACIVHNFTSKAEGLDALKLILESASEQAVPAAPLSCGKAMSRISYQNRSDHRTAKKSCGSAVEVSISKDCRIAPCQSPGDTYIEAIRPKGRALHGGALVSTGIDETEVAGRGAAGLVKSGKHHKCQQRLRIRYGCLVLGNCSSRT